MLGVCANDRRGRVDSARAARQGALGQATNRRGSRAHLGHVTQRLSGPVSIASRHRRRSRRSCPSRRHGLAADPGTLRPAQAHVRQPDGHVESRDCGGDGARRGEGPGAAGPAQSGPPHCGSSPTGRCSSTSAGTRWRPRGSPSRTTGRPPAKPAAFRSATTFSHRPRDSRTNRGCKAIGVAEVDPPSLSWSGPTSLCRRPEVKPRERGAYAVEALAGRNIQGLAVGPPNSTLVGDSGVGMVARTFLRRNDVDATLCPSRPGHDSGRRS